MLKINLYKPEGEEKKDESYVSRRIPVIESRDTKYVGSDGASVLGWTIPGDRIVLHNDVIEKMAYEMRVDPKKLWKETLMHELMHNVNPYASEAANRVATSYAMMASGKQPSILHTKYCFD